MISIFSPSSRKKDFHRRAVFAWIVRSTPHASSEECGARKEDRMSEASDGSVRCPRCGHVGSAADKFCVECGRFLRDASIDQRLLLALVHEREGREWEARQELQHLLDAEPDHVMGNHQLGNLLFHEGLLDLAIEHYRRAVTASTTFVLAYYDLGEQKVSELVVAQ